MKTKTEEYFREQAKLSAPEGFVCIGFGLGNDDDNLYHYFDDEIHKIHIRGNGESTANGFFGCLDDTLHYVKKEDWEEKFGPLNKQKDLSENNTENQRVSTPLLKIKSTPALVELVCEIMQGKMGDCRAKHFQFDYLYLDGGEVSRASNDFLKEYTEVSASEFIAALENLPDKPKDVVIDILPWKVVIKGDKVDIGCRKDVKFADLVSFVDDITSDYATGIYAFSGIKVNVGRNYVYTESYNIPWEKIEKFKRELKKVKDNS